MVNQAKNSHNNFGHRKTVTIALALLNAACQNYHLTLNADS